MDKLLRFDKRCKLALFLLMSIVGMSKTMAQYHYGITIGNLKYTLDDNTLTATVTGHKNGTSATGTLSFFSIVTYTDPFGVTRTYTVTAIGDYAFQYCRKLTGSLSIPNTITTIGKGAFKECSGFQYLNLGNSVTSIGNGAFLNCSGFKGNLTIPNSVIYIGNSTNDYDSTDGAFEGCSGFTGDLIIPNSVTTIGNKAFKFCTGFNGSLTIPSSVTDIGYDAFYICDDFTKVYYTGNIAQWCNITFGSFQANPVADVHRLYIDNTLLTHLVIPESVTSIKNYAFFDCTYLTGNLTIPNSVTTIGEAAFMYCNFTGNLTLGNSVTTIGSLAFKYCDGFTGSLIIPNSVTTIGRGAFKNCSGFTGSLIIPNSVTTIGILNDYYGDGAFEGCSGFTGNLTIGNSVTSIGDRSFVNCSGFTGNLTIGNSVTSIGDYSFASCSGFTGNLTIGNSVTTIGKSSFANCSGFTGNLTIGNSVTTIGYSSFANCSGFTGNLTIGNSVTTIGNSSFANCNAITSITALAQTPPTIEYNTFNNCPKSIPIYVPCCSVASYQSANGWNEFTNYQEMECPNYTIAVEANPPEGGIFVGAGEYEEGATCTLTATPAEGYQFVNWTENDTVVSTDASYTFTVTGDASFVANFVLYETQTITLTAGWNWFSTYIETDNPVDLLLMLEDGLGDNAVMILSMEDGMTEFDGEEWFGDLDDVGLANTQMYMVLANADCTVEMEGVPADLTEYEITIKPGWNWIGFPSAEALDVVVALANFAAEEGDIILSQNDGMTEYDGEDWFGDLETFAPGVGLMYYSTSSETKTLVYSTAAKGKGSIHQGKRK